MKIKRIASVFLLMLLPLTVLITVQCRHETSEPVDVTTSRSAAGGFAEDKVYSNASVEDFFVDNRVAVVLNRAASMNFKAYTPKDFPEIRTTRVTDSTDLIMDVVKQQLEAEKTRDFGKLKERIETGMLVDVDKFRRILYLDLPVKSKENVLEAIKLLEKREDILYAGPDYFIEPHALPDPLPTYYVYQQTALNSVSLPQAWDISVGSSIVKVGVLDTGIQANHPGLTGTVNVGLSRDFTTGTTNGVAGGLADPYGNNGHGTHVGGIITTNGNAGGVIGASWFGELVSLRVLNTAGWFNNDSTISLVNAISYAGNNGIPILNFSGGILSSWNITGVTELYFAIQNYSGLFVASAGNNDGANNDVNHVYPASWSSTLPNLIAVGALDDGNNRANFSNQGVVSVDLFAPGTNIYSAYKDFTFGPMSGTSMAAPYVAGVAALVYLLHPYMTGADLKTALKSSVDVLPELSGLCNTNGKINAYKAVNYIPIVGSINITFDGTGFTDVQGAGIGQVLAGKFHLFMNGTYCIAEMGKLSFPIQNFDIPTHYSQLVCGPVPAGITTYMAQSGIGLIEKFFHFYAPGKSPYLTYANYAYMPLIISIDSSGAQIVYPGAKFSTGEDLLLTDKRRIYASSTW